MSLVYVPALLSGIEFQVKKAKLDDSYKWKGYDGGWFTDNSIFQHEHVLTSYYYSGKIKKYKDTLSINKGKVLWADSGGFSLATKGAVIDPKKVLDWQLANSDIAFTLDWPPMEVDEGTQTSAGVFHYLSEKDFEINAIKTAANNEIFAKYKTKKLMIYNVIHGNRLEYMNTWWKYNGHFPFEGYATGSKPTGNSVCQAFNIAFLHSKGITSRIHLLGVSGIRVLPTLAYIGQYIDMLSYDSTSYGRGAFNRAYVLQDKMWDHFDFGAGYKKGSFKITCTCPVCKLIPNPDEFAAPGTWPGMLCALHNLCALESWTKELNSIVHDKEKFRANLKIQTGQKYEHGMAARGISFWDYYMRHGLEEAYVKFFASKSANENTRKVLF